jgi:predicted PP-loop superfamily ATPase
MFMEEHWPTISHTNKKRNAYKILLEKYNEYDPNATKQSVLRKINSLRCAYNKEYKKIKESVHSGAGTDDIYSPKNIQNAVLVNSCEIVTAF